MYHAAVATAGNVAFAVESYFGENVGNGTGSNIPPHVYAQIQNDEEPVQYSRIVEKEIWIYDNRGLPIWGVLRQGLISERLWYTFEIQEKITGYGPTEFVPDAGVRNRYAPVYIWINPQDAPSTYKFEEVRARVLEIFKDVPAYIIIRETTQSKEKFESDNLNFRYDLDGKLSHVGSYVYFSTKNGNGTVAKSGMEDFRTAIYPSSTWKAEYVPTGGVQPLTANSYANIIAHEVFLSLYSAKSYKRNGRWHPGFCVWNAIRKHTHEYSK